VYLLPVCSGENSSEMKRPYKDVDDVFVAWFSEATNKAFNSMELVREQVKAREPPEVLSIRATLEDCEIRFKWSKLIAIITGVEAIVVAVLKLWS
jgi:hypothetical protein